jgi:hypothetical protein
MTEFTGTILCGVCRGDLTGPSDFDNATVFRCSGCGQTEQYGKIVGEAQAYFTDALRAGSTTNWPVSRRAISSSPSRRLIGPSGPTDTF